MKETQIDKKGNLVVKTLFGELIHKKPLSYQNIEGSKIEVEAEYKNYSMHSYGFSAEEYYGNTNLIIDPIVLAYSTFLGGNGGDFGSAISIDKDGYI